MFLLLFRADEEISGRSSREISMIFLTLLHGNVSLVALVRFLPQVVDMIIYIS